MDLSDNNSVALLALDWGTSTLRAFLLAANGIVLEQRSRPWGISSLPEGGFPAAFIAITAGWPAGRLPAIASGMVGSRGGWKQVAYHALPCDPSALGAALDQVVCALPDGGETVLHLVPGLLDPTGPDVMRGEETEAIGALDALGAIGVLDVLENPDDPLLLVMPGTHSKWLHVRNRVLEGFSTYMTGELFALLSRQSILTTAPDTPPASDTERDDAFARAVREAADAGLSGALFRTRARMLTGELHPALTDAHLSGLLIGEELSHALTRAPGQRLEARIVLVGDPALTGRYARAFAALGRPVPDIIAAAAVRGLYRIAVAAGLVDDAGEAAPC